MLVGGGISSGSNILTLPDELRLGCGDAVDSVVGPLMNFEYLSHVRLSNACNRYQSAAAAALVLIRPVDRVLPACSAIGGIISSLNS